MGKFFLKTLENDFLYGEIKIDQFKNNFSEYEVTIQKKSDKRGKDANALSWVLIDRLAKHYESSKNEIYKLMIERYGVSTFLVVKPQEAERILNLLGKKKKYVWYYYLLLSLNINYIN